MNFSQRVAKKNNKRQAGSSLLQEGSIEERAKAFGVLFLPEAPNKIEKKVINLIPEDVAREQHLAAFEKKERLLKVAMVNPQDIEALNILRFITEKEKLEIEIYLISLQTFQDIIAQYSSTEKAVEEVIQSLKEEVEDFRLKREPVGGRIEEVIQDAPVSKLVQVIINHAIDGRASDVHIEPMDENYRVRFRMDGVLHSSLVLPKEVGKVIVSRIKILSNLKIDERRKPQDGRFKVKEQGRTIDFRVSTLPVIDGEKVVIRVLDREEGLLDFGVLGLIGRNMEILNKRIREPYGIILITGPTGSGKSTTLYAFLQVLNQEERNIITLEDPIEYYIEGVNQSQIKPEIGYTFASGLRSILRQDPNIIMVGEIRDGETAELAIHAALTGHLVFSTLHTNNSIGAIPRLVDMGIEPFLLSASLSVVAAQRLARKICPNCKEEISVPHGVAERIRKELEEIPPEEVAKYDLDLSQGIKFYQGKGCDLCNNVGLKGRMAVFEALEIDQRLQEVISEEKGGEAGIRKEAKRQKMITMRQDGILKVLKGITTLAEMERVTGGSLTVGGDVDDDQG
ncbi:MAG: GspE/PulE family protein [Candidatus Moranbacteria bacterium]|nr:GspE/PulE family protein [Candidatus Moranbacteria bacterium]